MPKQKILIYGANGHAKVVADIIEKENKYEIVGFIDDDDKKINKTFLSYKIIGNYNNIDEICKKYDTSYMIIAIGNNFTRKKIINKLQQNHSYIKYVSTIHPSTTISKHVKISDGNVIMANCSINSHTKILHHCIVNTGSIIEHDCLLENFSSTAPNSTLGGNVTLGECSVISISATIKHNVKIGKHSIVGAGSLVLKNIDSNVVAYGVPAIKVRDLEQKDMNYL